MVVHFGFWAFLLQSYLTATLFTLQIHSDEERLYVRELILFGFYSRLTSSPNPVRRSLVSCDKNARERSPRSPERLQA